MHTMNTLTQPHTPPSLPPSLFLTAFLGQMLQISFEPQLLYKDENQHSTVAEHVYGPPPVVKSHEFQFLSQWPPPQVFRIQSDNDETKELRVIRKQTIMWRHHPHCQFLQAGNS